MTTESEVEVEETEKESKNWINVQVDSQIFSTFLSCPRKCDYIFNRHLVPLTGASKSIQKGLLSHIGLQTFWQARIDGNNYHESCTLAIDKVREESIKYSNLEGDDSLLVLKTLVEFLKHNQSSSWIPLATEKVFRFIAYESFPLRIILTGRIDLIVKTPQINILPIDNKSESERWFYSAMSNQFKIYALSCKSNLVGVQRFGFQKTLEPKDKFKMELISFDQDTLDEFREEILPYYCGKLIESQETKYWPPNTSSCIHGHFACEFSDKYNNGGICSVSRLVREQKLERYFKVGEEWNPENL